jgi:O-acetyl-ADP-ribose deacetylase (regulator of RNase III)
MLEYIEGDIFNSPAQVIVNAVNTVGVMGKGIALSFKNRYPQMFEQYRKACENKTFRMGKLMLYHAPDHWVLLFPTKENWRNPSKLEYIESGLAKFVQCYTERNITSVAFPRLGCGNGELDWEVVRPLMEKYLKNLPIDVYIYLGKYDDSIPEHKQPEQTLEWLKKNAKDMSFNGLVDDISHRSALLPYEFSVGGKSVNMTYNNGLHFSIEGKDIEISEDDFYIFWDKIRSNQLITADIEDTQYYFVCELLLSLGYLSAIKLQDKKTGQMVAGYQLNEGLGRMCAIKG